MEKHGRTGRDLDVAADEHRPGEARLGQKRDLKFEPEIVFLLLDGLERKIIIKEDAIT
jgi:hypothetical protein